MKIYYGKFLRSEKILVTGGSYIVFFNSEQAVYDYEKRLEELGSYDILEYVGIADFNKRGVLVENEKTAKRVYDPNGEEDEEEDNDDDDE